MENNKNKPFHHYKDSHGNRIRLVINRMRSPTAKKL